MPGVHVRAMDTTGRSLALFLLMNFDYEGLARIVLLPQDMMGMILNDITVETCMVGG